MNLKYLNFQSELIKMELIYQAFEEYKKRGFVNLELVIKIRNEFDNFDIYKIVEKEKENKDFIKFWNNFNVVHINEKAVISVDECYICYEEDVGINTYCKHFGCFKCFDKICQNGFSVKCPYCRRELEFKNYADILDMVKMEGRNDNSFYDVDMIDIDRFIEDELANDDFDEDIEMDEVDRIVEEVIRREDEEERIRLEEMILMRRIN